MGQNDSSLEYGNCRDPCENADAVSSKSQLKVNFEKKSSSSHCEISVSCTSKGYDNVTTPQLLSIFRSIICQVVAYGRLKTKQNFELLALKVVAVAFELTRGSKYSDLTGKLLVF